jgi:RNA polymerase sigma-70 factor (ECF subfamily)
MNSPGAAMTSGAPGGRTSVTSPVLDAIALDSAAVAVRSPLAPEELDLHRRELTAYCYRMLGSGFEADDAVQETLVRAWRASDRFEGRSSLRSWLYKIATNVCLDMLRGRERRARPMELGASSPPDASHLGPLTAENLWVSPIADPRVLPTDADPAEIAAGRETIRLAFVTALQHLPARQRAVLVLCEVLRWQATEVAELLDTTVAAVNSALQRARATLATVQADDRVTAVDPGQRELLARYVDAFERYDVETLVTLLHDDAVQSMPPFAMWLQGSADIGAWLLGPGSGCRGSRLLATAANGCPAFGQYRVDPAGGHAPWALQVLEISGDRISGFHAFLDTNLFPAFGLPTHLPA